MTKYFNPEHFAKLREGVAAWNRWRSSFPDVRPDLRQVSLADARLFGTSAEPQLSHIDLRDAILFGADLARADLRRANLRNADLRGADLSGANLFEANLSQAQLIEATADSANLSGAILTEVNLRGADLSGADLRAADLSGATLSRAVLNGANLSRATLRRTFLRGATLKLCDLTGAFMSDVDFGEADLSGANLTDAHLRGAYLNETSLANAELSGANLTYARFVQVDLSGASLKNCSIYGISAWGLNMDRADQSNLVITRPDESTITVDNLEVAQFIYLLLNNRKIRDVIESITSKAVLILGRFTAERKPVLDALRDELRRRDFLPIVFDFDKPSSRNLTETVSTLAHIARFVIADITEAKSIPQELQRIVPDLPSLPVQPLLLASEYKYGMFRDFEDYPWVLEPYRYDSLEQLVASLEERVLNPVIAKATEIEHRRLFAERALRP